MINKDFVLLAIDEVNKIKDDSIIEITKEYETLRYQIKYDSYGWYELVCLDQDDAIWGDYPDDLEYVKQSLVCDAVRDYYQNIKIIK